MGGKNSKEKPPPGKTPHDKRRPKPAPGTGPIAAAPDNDPRLRPTALYAKCDWPPPELRRMVKEARLAPFTVGRDEPGTLPPDFRPGAEPTAGGDPWAGLREECPMCMLWYPPGLNLCAVCGQGLCSDCWAQVVTPQKRFSCRCPFCNDFPFVAHYRGPKPLGAVLADVARRREAEAAEQRIKDDAVAAEVARLEAQRAAEERRAKEERRARRRERRARQCAEEAEATPHRTAPAAPPLATPAPQPRAASGRRPSAPPSGAFRAVLPSTLGAESPPPPARRSPGPQTAEEFELFVACAMSGHRHPAPAWACPLCSTLQWGSAECRLESCGARLRRWECSFCAAPGAAEDTLCEECLAVRPAPTASDMDFVL